MKTRQPLILTARVDDDDLAPFDRLRQAHFPPERNFLSAHLTMFHRLPGEYRQRISDTLGEAVSGRPCLAAEVTGLRHLGMGVAYSIAGTGLQKVRHHLRQVFLPWLGSQDMRAWQPHITIQNKASKAASDALFLSLSQAHQPSSIRIVGLDLWAYLDGPWRLEQTFPFVSDAAMAVRAEEKQA